MFTGDPPFASTPDNVLFTIVCDRGGRPPRPADPDTEARGLDDAVWALMAQCWAQEPADRPGASALYKALERICRRPLEASADTQGLENTIRQLLSKTEETVETPTGLDSKEQGYTSFTPRGLARLPTTKTGSFEIVAHSRI